MSSPADSPVVEETITIVVADERTVESHRAHIQRKLGRSTRAELVRSSLDHGLLEP
jgi:FixJ family two-component response regulator